MKTFFYLLSFVLSATYAYPQEFKPDHIMYGVAYYDVYMPEDRLEQDIELMKECGINTVRIGESTWSQWEPADGVFDFSDLDRMLDAFHDAGIQVIVGTPGRASRCRPSASSIAPMFIGSRPSGRWHRRCPAIWPRPCRATCRRPGRSPRACSGGRGRIPPSSRR